MIYLASRCLGLDVYTLRTGGQIGKVTGLLVDPRDLNVVALRVDVRSQQSNMLLLKQDIREINFKGVIVDDLHSFATSEELPALKEIIKIDYQLVDKKVIAGKNKLGKVGDFSVDLDSFEIANILVTPGIFNRLNTSRLNIGRNQIIEVNDREIIVSEATVNETDKKRSLAGRPRTSPTYPASTSETSE